MFGFFNSSISQNLDCGGSPFPNAILVLPPMRIDGVLYLIQHHNYIFQRPLRWYMFSLCPSSCQASTGLHIKAQVWCWRATIFQPACCVVTLIHKTLGHSSLGLLGVCYLDQNFLPSATGSVLIAMLESWILYFLQKSNSITVAFLEFGPVQLVKVPPVLWHLLAW